MKLKNKLNNNTIINIMEELKYSLVVISATYNNDTINEKEDTMNLINIDDYPNIAGVVSNFGNYFKKDYQLPPSCIKTPKIKTNKKGRKPKEKKVKSIKCHNGTDNQFNSQLTIYIDTSYIDNIMFKNKILGVKFFRQHSIQLPGFPNDDINLITDVINNAKNYINYKLNKNIIITSIKITLINMKSIIPININQGIDLYQFRKILLTDLIIDNLTYRDIIYTGDSDKLKIYYIIDSNNNKYDDRTVQIHISTTGKINYIGSHNRYYYDLVFKKINEIIEKHKEKIIVNIYE